MKGKNIMQALLMAILIVALPAVIAFDGKVAKANDIALEQAKAMDEEVMAKIPKTYEATAKKIVPIRNRYLLWTNNGRHIMWGTYGRGFFVGQDNLGKNVWGIYGKTVFAGLYDGKFFYGRYGSGKWKAHGLFDMRTAYGKYVLFPTLTAVTAEALPK